MPRPFATTTGTFKDGAEATAGSGTKYKTLMNLLMQLRKCCDHPFLFSGAEDDPDETTYEGLAVMLIERKELALRAGLLMGVIVKMAEFWPAGMVTIGSAPYSINNFTISTSPRLAA